MHILRTLLFIVFLFLIGFPISAQHQVSVHADLGSTTMNSTIYLQTALTGKSTIKSFFAEYGLLVNCLDNLKSGYSSSFISGGKSFTLHKNKLNALAYYLHSYPSSTLREENFGLKLTYETSHWDIMVGNNSKRYVLRNDFKSQLPIEQQEDHKIYEWRNALYRICYKMKPEDYLWNFKAGVTNADFFLINQGTNPMIFAEYNYTLLENLKLNCSIFYKGAGSMNLQADYFGYFIRTGIQWKIK